MSTQYEALWLAESLELTNGLAVKKEAAAELRRLHKENKLLNKTARLYEELRQTIDGNSESLTHAGALEAVKFWKGPAAPASPQGYAGVTIWIGNRKITQLLTEVQIEYERLQGQSITEAAKFCLERLAAASEQKGDAV